MPAIRKNRLVGQPELVVRWLFLAVLLVTPLAFSLSSFRVFAPAKRFMLITAASAFIFVSRARWLRQLKNLAKKPAELSLGLFVAYILLSSMWSPYAGEATLCALSLFAWYFLYLAVPAHFIYEVDVRKILWVLAVGLIINNLLAVLQVAGLWLPPFLQGGDGPFGWIGNKNWFATYLALLLPIELWMLIHRPSKNRTFLAMANLFTGLPLLLTIWCRGAWLAFSTGILVWGLMRVWGRDVARLKRRLALAVLAAFIGALAVLGLSAWSPERLISLWGRMKQQTIESRLLAWRLTWRGIRGAAVFGHGLGAFGGEFTRMQEKHFADFPRKVTSNDWLLARPFRHAHNDAIELAFEGGVVGCVLCLCVLYYAVRRFFSIAQRIPEGPDRSLSLLFFGLAAATVAASLTGYPFRQTTAALLFLVFLCGTKRDHAGGRLDPPAPGIALSAFSFFLALVLFSLGLCDFVSEIRRGRAIELLARGRLEQAETELKGALAFNPLNGRARLAMARCRLAQRKFDEAEELFRRGSKDYLDHTTAYNLGVLESGRKRFARAAEYFTRSLRQLPGPQPLAALAKVRMAQGNSEEAERLCRLALKADPGNCDASSLLVKVLAKSGREKEALEQVQTNIAVMDARLAAGLVLPDYGVCLVKNLETLSFLSKRAGRLDLFRMANDRLDRYRSGKQ